MSSPHPPSGPPRPPFPEPPPDPSPQASADPFADPPSDEQAHLLACQRAAGEEARALLAAIVESSEDAILSKTLEGRILSWNEGARRMLGYAPAEIIGQPVILLVPPDRLDEEGSFLERVGRGERVEHYDTVRVAQDGRRVDVSLMLSPVRDHAGRVVAISSIARDVTGRKRTEQRLHTQYEITRALAESRTLAEAGPRVLRIVCDFFAWDAGCLLTVDEEGRSLRCVETWHRPEIAIPGFEAATRATVFAPGVGLPGRVWQAALPVWIPDVTRDTNFPRARVASSEGLHAACGFPILMQERVLGVVEFFSCEVRPPDRDLIRMMTAIGSQTGQFIERKRAEDARNEADRRKDEFLAMLAHELRNPLAPIRNAAQVLGAQVSGPELRWASEMIERQVQQMTRLIDDLLDVSRITRGKITLRKERLDLAAVAAGAVEAGCALVGDAGHALAVALPREPVVVEGDPTRLAQIVLNLLSNAAKYTEPGGRIELAVAREGAHATIRVRDTGIGIPHEMLPRIFELFTQGDRSLERSEGGLGIGLTLVQRLAELHGGDVTAHSDGPGKGSEFVVRLPLPPEVARADGAPPVAETEALPFRGLRILIVDDNRDSATSLAELLRLRGHETHVAHDGLEALQVMAGAHPGVALLDLGLPRMSGYELAQRIRGQEDGGGIVLIALTGWGQDEDRRRSRDAGFDFHLTKPIEFSALARLLAELPPGAPAAAPSAGPVAPATPAAAPTAGNVLPGGG